MFTEMVLKGPCEGKKKVQITTMKVATRKKDSCYIRQ